MEYKICQSNNELSANLEFVDSELYAALVQKSEENNCNIIEKIIIYFKPSYERVTPLGWSFGILKKIKQINDVNCSSNNIFYDFISKKLVSLELIIVPNMETYLCSDLVSFDELELTKDYKDKSDADLINDMTLISYVYDGNMKSKVFDRKPKQMTKNNDNF